MILLIGLVLISGMPLYQYSVWIFQSINQLMRVRLIDQLQMQSLAFHSQTQTGDAIYRIYQASAIRQRETRILIVIAHGLSTIRMANRICTVDDGRIVESGRHEELMQNPSGAYRRFFELQLG